MALTSTKIITLDELRLTAESFGQKYFEMEYFHRNARALVEICHQRELFTEAEFLEELNRQKKYLKYQLLTYPIRNRSHIFMMGLNICTANLTSKKMKRGRVLLNFILICLQPHLSCRKKCYFCARYSI